MVRAYPKESHNRLVMRMDKGEERKVKPKRIVCGVRGSRTDLVETTPRSTRDTWDQHHE